MNTYETLLHQLFEVNLGFGLKLGLKNSEALHEACGYPASSFKTVHVAGSNGKGSTCIKIAKALASSGLKVGLYTSPHISSFRERIQINGLFISEDEVARHLNDLFHLMEVKKIPATFFEITTMLGFLHFKEANVDIAVLETGLGGRLDATNIVTPELSIITSISLDHTAILGHTLEEIALEKAGIIKPGVPVVIGEKVPFSVIGGVALKNKSRVIEVKGPFSSFEEENNAISRAALKELGVEEMFIAEGLKAKQPCRFETVEKDGKTFILDVAHNPDGLRRLFQDVARKFPHKKLEVIFGLSQNKDVEACVEVIKNKGVTHHLVSARNGRGISLNELKKYFKEKERVFCHESVEEAIMECQKSEVDLIVICGTFFIMGDARRALGIDEPCDPWDNNER